MANAFSIVEAERSLLRTTGFISLEHLVSCDPFFFNFPEHSCPYPYSNKPLLLIIHAHFSFIIYPKAYLLLSLNEVVSAAASVFPPAFFHNYEDISICIHSLQEVAIPVSSKEEYKEMGLAQSKVSSEISCLSLLFFFFNSEEELLFFTTGRLFFIYLN